MKRKALDISLLRTCYEQVKGNIADIVEDGYLPIRFSANIVEGGYGKMRTSQLVIISIFLLLSIFVGALFWGIYTSQMHAIMAAQSLELKLGWPTGFSIDLSKGELSMKLKAVLGNRGPVDVEIDGGDYDVYLVKGLREYRIASGKLGKLHVDAGSNALVDIDVKTRLAELGEVVQEVVGGGFKGSFIELKITLYVPVKVFSVKTFNIPVRLNAVAHPKAG